MLPDENLQLEGEGIGDTLKKGFSSLLKKGISKAKKSGSKLLKKGISKAKVKTTGRQLLNKLKGNTNLKSKILSLAKKKINEGKRLVKSKVTSLAKSKVNQAKALALSKISKKNLKSTLNKQIKPLLKRKLKPLLSPSVTTKKARIQRIQNKRRRGRRGRKRSVSKRNRKKFEKGLIPDSHYWMY